MFITILILLLFIASAGCLVVGVTIYRKHKDTRRGDDAPGALTAVIGAVLGLIAVLMLIFSSVATVGTSDVGVETAFGKTVGDFTPGFHLKPPWVAVTAWDHSVQSVTYGRDTNQSHADHCLLVRIGNQQSACATLTFTYQVWPGASDRLFKAYRGDQSRMHELLVVRTLDSEINAVLENYSPIAASANGNTAAAKLSPYARQVEAAVRGLIGNDITVGPHALVFQYMAYDPSTTSHINQYQAQIYKTAIARQAVVAAGYLAQANRILAASVSNDPNVIAYQCFIKVAEPMVANGQNPAGFNCWPGSGGSTVVVPGK